MIVRGVHGSIFELEQKAFSGGGEGDVYGIIGKKDNVVKIYHKDKVTTELEEKIKYMVEKQPNKNVINQVAWPLDAVYDHSGIFCGFLMPRLNIDISLKEIYPYPPQTHITYQQKIIIAQNICAVISAVHEAGYIFGDFNPLNIGVNVSTGKVAFLDTDSYHIVLGGQKSYRCKVCLDGYVAPELLKKCEAYKKDAYANAPLPTFTKETDNFALAIHIFKLLMNGFTPFNGIKETDSISMGSPGKGNQAIKQDSYCFKPGNKPQAVAVPSIEVLPEDIIDLFTRAFMFGKLDPSQRPSAREWHKALSDYADNLIACSKNPTHMYRNGLSTCPWCEADDRHAVATAPALKQISFTNVPNPVVVPVTASTSSKSSIGINRVTSTCNLVFPVIKSGIIKVGKWFSGLSRKAKTVLGTSVGVFVLFCMLISVVNHIIIPNAKYDSAMQMLENEQYSDAYNAFIGLGSHEDSAAMAVTAKQLETNSLHYSKALSLLDENSKEEAISEFEQANGYKDSNEQIAVLTESINREKYEEAENLLSDGKFDEAITAFSQIKDYSDSKEQITQIEEMKLENRYNEAGAFRESGEYDKAAKIYEELDAYKDSSDLYLESMYDYVVSHKIATDNRTQKYLIELKKIGYEDAQYIYDSLFYYYVEIIMNNDPDDVTTDMPVIAWRDKDSKIYGHVKLCFTGEYDMLNDEGIILKYQFDIYSFTDAQSGEWEFKFTPGQTGWAFPGINSYGSGVGASRFRVFDEKGNILGSKTFEITRIN